MTTCLVIPRRIAAAGGGRNVLNVEHHSRCHVVVKVNELAHEEPSYGLKIRYERV